MAHLSATRSLKPLSALRFPKRDATTHKYTIAAIYPGQEMCVSWQAGASREHDSFAGAILGEKNTGERKPFMLEALIKE